MCFGLWFEDFEIKNLDGEGRIRTNVGANYLSDHLGGQNTMTMLETEGHLPHLSAPLMLAQNLRPLRRRWGPPEGRAKGGR